MMIFLSDTRLYTAIYVALFTGKVKLPWMSVTVDCQYLQWMVYGLLGVTIDCQYVQWTVERYLYGLCARQKNQAY
jgi:hypothetical protein